MIEQKVKITECPRDAMQGLSEFVPTALKAEYLNALLRIGFDRLDFGSFVSPKAIPQMRDTAAVLELLEADVPTDLIAIVANARGAQDACMHGRIDFLGYPLSVSETFQLRNTNADTEVAFSELCNIQSIAGKHSKNIIVYLSMAFGNPYGEPYHPDLVVEHMFKLQSLGFSHFALADTVGLATPETIYHLVRTAINEFGSDRLGVHLHSRPDNWKGKLAAAIDAGCNMFDSAIGGYGGCPMAGDGLVGNFSTEWLIQYFDEQNVSLKLNREALATAQKISSRVFSQTNSLA